MDDLDTKKELWLSIRLNEQERQELDDWIEQGGKPYQAARAGLSQYSDGIFTCGAKWGGRTPMRLLRWRAFLRRDGTVGIRDEHGFDYEFWNALGDEVELRKLDDGSYQVMSREDYHALVDQFDL